MAKIYRFQPAVKAARPPGAAARETRGPQVPGAEQALRFMALQDKTLRDGFRALTRTFPGPYTAIDHDEDRALVVDRDGRAVTEDLYHRLHARYVASFMNLHAAERKSG